MRRQMSQTKPWLTITVLIQLNQFNYQIFIFQTNNNIKDNDLKVLNEFKTNLRNKTTLSTKIFKIDSISSLNGITIDPLEVS
jgi:hypothetical protein